MLPHVDVIIPHYKGSEKLMACLQSLYRTQYDKFNVILVDNGCQDDSVDEAKNKFAQLEILKLNENLGFAGGCNAGVKHSECEYVALLNDDTEVEPDWLTHLMNAVQSDERIAVAQPKLRWIIDKDKFDYAGAMGGLMDVFGFPFCYGRMFETIETDEGQYDWVEDIFWASGSACLFRRKLYDKAGGLDDRFFAHQEEIDLNWRLHLMGYRIVAVPQAVVYHYAGATLPPANFTKKYLNHRNSIMMLFKNYQLRTLMWIIPCRFALEMAAIILAVKQRDYRRILAIFGAGFWNLFNLPYMISTRKSINRIRKISDREIIKKLYKGTVALQYYVKGKQTFFQLFHIEEEER